MLIANNLPPQFLAYIPMIEVGDHLPFLNFKIINQNSVR